MSVLRWKASTGRGVAVLVAAAVLATLPGAVAGTAAPEPVIDRAPGRVGFRSDVVIAGHLEDGDAGDLVSLQRMRTDGAFKAIQVRAIDPDGRVSFEVERVRTTTLYRFYWADPSTDRAAASDPVRVQVEPALRLRPRPDDVFEGAGVKISGYLYPKVARPRKVTLQQWVEGSWRPLARVPVARGRFSFRFRPAYRSHRTVRAIFLGGDLNTEAVTAKPLRVYEAGLATWYGPGFYGNSTACGQRLDYDTLGVAHRTLPCGTRVSLFYRGRSITVRVIDRGPYTSADWDLTGATARRIGFSGKENIGVAY